MKAHHILLTILLITNSLLAQQKSLPVFQIDGQLTNSPEQQLLLAYRMPDGNTLLDTLQLDSVGRFSLSSSKVQVPCLASIQKNRTQINDFFVAPGYQLTITGDATDFMTLFTSKRITGKGAAVNRYRILLDSIMAARKDYTSWFDLDKDALLNHVKKDQQLKDSIAGVVFGQKNTTDKWFSYFASMVKYDNQFLSLYKLLAHVNQSQYNQQQSQAFIQQNINKGLLSDLYNAKYLISDNYRTWVMVNEWPTYLFRLNRLKDNLEKQHKPDLLATVATHYPAGKVKDYTMHSLMQGAIEFTKTLAKLNEYKSQFGSYIDSLSNDAYKTAIATAFDNKLTDLLRTQTGKPAPAFSLLSSENKTHSLEDFKGKVVYIDLWASWCKPCRAETPAFKLLYNKYKADDRIAFISIAVQDGATQWRKALAEDQLDWLQLIDKDATVWKSYVANSIPKFIIVNKLGNIANFDAPRPSDGKALEDLLETEMAK